MNRQKFFPKSKAWRTSGWAQTPAYYTFGLHNIAKNFFNKKFSAVMSDGIQVFAFPEYWIHGFMIWPVPLFLAFYGYKFISYIEFFIFETSFVDQILFCTEISHRHSSFVWEHFHFLPAYIITVLLPPLVFMYFSFVFLEYFTTEKQIDDTNNLMLYEGNIVKFDRWSVSQEWTAKIVWYTYWYNNPNFTEQKEAYVDANKLYKPCGEDLDKIEEFCKMEQKCSRYLKLKHKFLKNKIT